MERFEFYSRATLTKRASDDCNPRLAVIVNLPIVSTDGVFEGKSAKGLEQLSHDTAQDNNKLSGCLYQPVLKLVSYRHMSASDKC